MYKTRKYIRIKLRQSLRVGFGVVSKEGKPKGRKGYIFPVNMSAGGMFFEIEDLDENLLEDLQGGSNKFIFEIQIPGYSSKIEIPAKAVWIEQKEGKDTKRIGIGVQFEKLLEKDRERLVKHLLECILQ